MNGDYKNLQVHTPDKFFFERSGHCPALINNKEKEQNIRLHARAAPPHCGLSRAGVGNNWLTNYSLIVWTTKRDCRTEQPAKLHWCAVSFISISSACAVLHSCLKTTAFRLFQMLHRVRIARVWLFFPPDANIWLNQSSSSCLTSQFAGCRLEQELHEATSCQTRRE